MKAQPKASHYINGGYVEDAGPRAGRERRWQATSRDTSWEPADFANDLLFVGIIQRRSGPPGGASHEEISRRVIAEALPKP